MANTGIVRGTRLLMALLVTPQLTVFFFLSLPAFFFTASVPILLLAYSLPPIR
ncbi:MAG: hypothetical protein WCF90_07400 [Methanomicrobiales archaeon]